MADRDEREMENGEGELEDADEELELEDVEEEAEGDSDEEAVAGAGKAEEETAEGDWFVDFDVWLATLEANFGPDFESVLSRELGPDWVNQLNKKMVSADSFYNVVQDLKHKITTTAETAGENGTSEEVDPGKITFEALEPGEIIYDEKVVRPAGQGEGGSRKMPNLSDLRRKEWEEGKDLEAQETEEDFEEELRDDTEAADDSNLVLMERNEFSRLSYFAHKEIDRHRKDLKTSDVLGRKGRGQEESSLSTRARLLLLVTVLFSLYVLYALVGYPMGRYFAAGVAENLPPDYYFQPSSSLHRQGMLYEARGGVDDSRAPVIIYFLHSAIERLEIKYPAAGLDDRFDLTGDGESELGVADLRGDSLNVRRGYSLLLPTNLGGLTGRNLFELHENGALVMSARESAASSLIPGLVNVGIYDGGDTRIGSAVVASGRLAIAVDNLDSMPAPQRERINLRLVLLFSLLDV